MPIRLDHPRALWLLALPLVFGNPGDGGATVIGVQPPQIVASTDGQSATLAIPRWKGYMDPAQPTHFWLTYSNASSGGSNVVFSTDGGATWQNTGMNPNANGYLDYHVALVGFGSNLYYTFPGLDGIRFRRFLPPAQSNDDAGPLITLNGTASSYRSSITLDGNGRLWIFTRDSDNAGANVRYQYSTNQGTTWTSGVAVATGTPNVRIGSMPLADGRVCLVVLHLQDPRGYEYFVWNGTQFEARPDHSMYADDVGYSRAFTHNVVGDKIHLIFGLGNAMHHVWKAHNGGVGTWHSGVIFTSNTTDGIDMLPTCTVRGDELFLFYCKWSGSTVETSRVVARVWNQINQNWGPEIPVSGTATTTNIHPNTCFRVPTAAAYIPVFWTAGGAGNQIVYSELTLDVNDEVPPAAIDDLGGEEGDAAGHVELSWTAPGDDGNQGQAVAYDIRYSPIMISGLTWNYATQVSDEPVPAPAGVVQSLVVDGLEPGVTYYFAAKTVDDEQNVSGLSNVPRIEAPIGTAAPDGDLPAMRVLPNYPNPFNPRTVIPFELPRAATARLTVHDLSGRLVAVLVDGSLAAGRHEATWDGLGRDDRALPSGTYHVRLAVGDEVNTRPITLIR